MSTHGKGPPRKTRRTVEVAYDAEQGHWCIIIPCPHSRRDALKLGRALGKFLAPAELKPRRKDGRWAQSGRETYGQDPKASKG